MPGVAASTLVRPKERWSASSLKGREEWSGGRHESKLKGAPATAAKSVQTGTSEQGELGANGVGPTERSDERNDGKENCAGNGSTKPVPTDTSQRYDRPGKNRAHPSAAAAEHVPDCADSQEIEMRCPERAGVASIAASKPGG